jgi:hypothetical protein
MVYVSAAVRHAARYLRVPGPGECELCGCSPSLPVTFRSVRGLAVVHRVVTVRGTLCRSCALAHGRERTARTLVEGWWSIGAFVAVPLLLVLNARGLRRAAGLADPRPNEGIASYLDRPLDAGRPVMLRASILGPIVPLLAVVLVIALAVGR